MKWRELNSMCIEPDNEFGAQTKHECCFFGNLIFVGSGGVIERDGK